MQSSDEFDVFLEAYGFCECVEESLVRNRHVFLPSLWKESQKGLLFIEITETPC